MPLTNFPGGISAPNLGGQVVGGSVVYVGNRSGLPAGDGSSPDYPCSTLNSALGKCVANRGDVVRILPGHVETISSADQMSNLVAGTTIEGVATGTKGFPVLRWTAATATFLLDVAGVTVRNLWLQMAGDPDGSTALSVTAPMTISGDRCTLENCLIQVGIDADQLATTAITVTGDDVVIQNVEVYGAAAAEVAAVIVINSANRFKLLDSRIEAASATDAAGIIKSATAASSQITLRNLFVHANGTGNTACIDFSANVAVTGWMDYILMRNRVDANTSWLIATGTGVDLTLGDDVYGVNATSERGKQIGDASV